MTNYRIRKNQWLENSLQYGQSLNQIYECAHERQFKLISKCFMACLKSLKETQNVKEVQYNMILQLNDYFYSINVADLKSITDYQNMVCEFTNQTALQIKDGGVKSKDRALYKINTKFNGRADMIDDINRVTILSSNYDLIEKFMNNFSKMFEENELSPEKDWTMQNYGLLSKSKDVLIDGYPAEVHINETGQNILSQALTHKVYEVIRLTENDPNFNDEFVKLPITAVKTAISSAGALNETQKTIMTQLLKDLNTIVKNNEHSTYFKKKESLIKFHQHAHQSFIWLADKKWRNIYFTALDNYNSQGSQKIDTVFAMQSETDYNKVGFSKSVWSFNPKRRISYD